MSGKESEEKKNQNPPWLIAAKKEIGEAEIPGVKNNQRIIDYHNSTILKATQDSVPWCSAFVNFIMKSCGLPYTNKANARSWMKYGRGIEEPKVGCIVVLSRGSNPIQGHVGFFIGFTPDDKILILGGNQGDKVSIMSFLKSRVIAYRWPL